MTTSIRLKIVGPLPIHGKKPGDEFEVPTDADGVPLVHVWRKRLADERNFSVGAVAVVSASAASPANTDTKDE